MPRIRSIKPEFWTDTKVIALSPLARLLFIGMWNYADDYGAVDDDPMQLKLRVLPAEQSDPEQLIDELIKADLVRRKVSPDGEVFLAIKNWDKHQRVSNPSNPKFGDPKEWQDYTNPRESSESLASPSEDSVPSSEHSSVMGGKEGGSGREGTTPPGGNGQPPFEKRLANELRQDHGSQFNARDTLHASFMDLLTEALDKLPEDRHHNVSMGVIARFVEEAQGIPISSESRSHTANLVRTHDPLDVLDGYGEALRWGAGIDEKYADDALRLSKYVAKILANRTAA